MLHTDSLCCCICRFAATWKLCRQQCPAKRWAYIGICGADFCSVVQHKASTYMRQDIISDKRPGAIDWYFDRAGPMGDRSRLQPYGYCQRSARNSGGCLLLPRLLTFRQNQTPPYRVHGRQSDPGGIRPVNRCLMNGPSKAPANSRRRLNSGDLTTHD